MSELFPAEVLAEIEKNSPEPLAFERHFNGARLEQNEKLCADIVSMVAMGVPAQKLAMAFRVSRNSIAALVERAEKDGRLPDARSRIKHKMTILVEDTLDDLIEKRKTLAEIPACAFTDKILLLDGQPTTIIKDVTENSTADAVERLKRASTGIIDVEEVK